MQSAIAPRGVSLERFISNLCSVISILISCQEERWAETWRQPQAAGWLICAFAQQVENDVSKAL